MTSERFEFSLEKLGRALDRLEEALALPGEGIAIDATIQRFEFTFELFWKTLKRALQEAGRHPSGSPRDVLSFGWRDDWLDDDEQLWIDMLADRNRTSHVYDEAMALEIYEHIRAYTPHLRRAYEDLCRRFRITPGGPGAASEARERGAPYRAVPVRGARPAHVPLPKRKTRPRKAVPPRRPGTRKAGPAKPRRRPKRTR